MMTPSHTWIRPPVMPGHRGRYVYPVFSKHPWLKAGHKEFQDATWFVDTGFLRVFSYPLESGDPLTALRGKYNVILAHAEKWRRNCSVRPPLQERTASWIRHPPP